MIGNNVLGVIFANFNDNLIPELTEHRSLASIPFGSRYRLIDFSLSNLVNAGISKVGIITKENYGSLMDHLGSGKFWDLDRKNGGIFIMPPFSNAKYGFFKGHVDALNGISTFLTKSREEYVVMCDADVVSNINIDDMISQHIKSGADITIAYKNGKYPENSKGIMRLNVGENGVIDNIALDKGEDGSVDFGLDIYVIRRELLLKWVEIASRRGENSLTKEILLPKASTGTLYGYKVDSFAEVVDSAKAYVGISKMLLEKENRASLFNKERPVYTKVRDDVPTRYGINAETSNSLIADGCVIEGTVTNSILFRGVKIAKGAKVNNCILMQGTEVGEDVELENVTADKGAKITDGTVFKGRADKNVFIAKEKTV